MAISASAILALLSIGIELMYLIGGSGFHWIPLLLIVFGCTAHWRAVKMFLKGPFPFASRTMPLIGMCLAWAVVFLVVLVQI